MYKLFIANNKTEKKLKDYIKIRPDIKRKLDSLKLDPYKSCGSHLLHGKLKGKRACWLGSNIRMIFSINEESKTIFIEAVGSHKIY